LTWFSKTSKGFTRELDLNDLAELEAMVEMHAVRLGLDEGTVRTAYIDSFRGISKLDLLHPADYERRLMTLAENFPEGGLTDQQIIELTMARGRAEGLGKLELTELRATVLEGVASNSRRRAATRNIAKFSQVVDGLEEGFVNVHLLRDGSFNQLSEFVGNRVKGEVSEARSAFVSTLTLGGEKNVIAEVRVFDSVKKARNSASTTPQEFYDEFFKEFKVHMDTDVEFRTAVDEALKHLDSMGILDNDKIRFLDTGATGNVPLFLEGAIHHSDLNVKTSSFLMDSDIHWLSANIDSFSEELAKPGTFTGARSLDGDPLITLHPSDGDKASKLAESYFMELITAQETVNVFSN